MLTQNVGTGLLVLGLLLVVFSMIGSYGAWKAADESARAYEGETPLRKMTAELLRQAVELRGRVSHEDRQPLPFNLHTEVAVFLKRAYEAYASPGAIDLSAKFEADTGDFPSVTDGRVTREEAVGALGRAIASLTGIQQRLTRELGNGVTLSIGARGDRTLAPDV